MEKGKTLGLALDLEAGMLLVSADGGDWTVAFPNSAHTGPCRPSYAAGAALFPVLCGCGGVRVRCNWGADAQWPMRHGPPSEEYCAVGLRRLAPQVRVPVPLLV